ncbi:MAG: FGGY-family carbohydrate kinase [Oscillospiraceae bacterium]|nr:FGGY-family carbohydrate kinase [Oscillospiraceae bacterium]
MNEALKEAITQGKTALGLEFGSTNIKAVLIGPDHSPIASGSHGWENRLENGIWTYPMEAVWAGLQDAYSKLAADVQEKYGVTLTTVGALGFSAMMHGYLAFDGQGELLVPFRTWRNTITAQASEELTELFGFNIPQRWSIAHLEQAILNGEEHVPNIAYLTTLAGYVHWKLTGRKVLGIGEASGMFPIDSETNQYDAVMVKKYDALLAERGYSFTLEEILPEVLLAGEDAGSLTPEGAALLDSTGNLKPGIPMAPPEGDAGTGMCATNSVAARTGNTSAGTSVFAMVVLEKPLSKVYPEIDLVTTPTGKAVAMVHCNNCTSDINAWVGLFREFGQLFGLEVSENELYTRLFQVAMEGDEDCGGLLSYNYYSGEPVTGLTEGRPLFLRQPDAKLTLSNFMRTHLQSALAALKVGLDILAQEDVKIDAMYGHGGYFKTKGVGQALLAAAINAPVCVMETAGEGGPWGMALLAAYLVNREPGESLEDYLQNKVFANTTGEKLEPVATDVAGFDAFLCAYRKALPAEQAAVEHF